MSTPSTEDFKKASEVAKSLIGHLNTNGPLLIALATASVVAVFACSGLRWEAQVASQAAAGFFIAYYLLVRWYLYRPVREAKYHLRRLGVEEQTLLRSFLLENKRTAHLNSLYAPSASLIAKGILSYASGIFPVLTAPVVIQPYAWQYLSRHPELVGLKRADIGSKDYHDDSPWLTKP